MVYPPWEIVKVTYVFGGEMGSWVERTENVFPAHGRSSRTVSRGVVDISRSATRPADGFVKYPHAPGFLVFQPSCASDRGGCQ